MPVIVLYLHFYLWLAPFKLGILWCVTAITSMPGTVLNLHFYLWLAPLSLWISCPVRLLLSALSSMAGPVYASAILCLSPFCICIFIYGWHHCPRGFHAPLSYCFPRFHLWLAPFTPVRFYAWHRLIPEFYLCLAPFEQGII